MSLCSYGRNLNSFKLDLILIHASTNSCAGCQNTHVRVLILSHILALQSSEYNTHAINFCFGAKLTTYCDVKVSKHFILFPLNI